VVPYGESFNGRLPSTTSDENGAFRIVCPSAGRVRVIAYKETDGYPNTLGVLFSNGDEQSSIVDIIPGQTAVNFDVKLPPKDGVIFGTVHDSRTGATVAQTRITMRWTDKPEVMYSSYVKDEGKFIFALPPRPIKIDVTAPGYRPWHYVDAGSGAEFLSLPLGSRLIVSVNLAPE
jgi:hypothetical protein